MQKLEFKNNNFGDYFGVKSQAFSFNIAVLRAGEYPVSVRESQVQENV